MCNQSWPKMVTALRPNSKRNFNFYLPRIIRQVDRPVLFNLRHNEANDQFFRLVRIAARRWRWLTAFFFFCPDADLLIRAKRATCYWMDEQGTAETLTVSKSWSNFVSKWSGLCLFRAGAGSIAAAAGQREQLRGIIPLSIRPFDCRRRIFHTANNLPACVKCAPGVRL